jgi:hypothetical protein
VNAAGNLFLANHSTNQLMGLAAGASAPTPSRGTFLQSQPACGRILLSRLTLDMHTTRVDIAGVSDSVEVLGFTGDKLLSLTKIGCAGTTSPLTYDPAANTSTVRLGPPVNGGGVTEALLYPDRKQCRHEDFVASGGRRLDRRTSRRPGDSSCCTNTRVLKRSTGCHSRDVVVGYGPSRSHPHLQAVTRLGTVHAHRLPGSRFGGGWSAGSRRPHPVSIPGRGLSPTSHPP